MKGTLETRSAVIAFPDCQEKAAWMQSTEVSSLPSPWSQRQAVPRDEEERISLSPPAPFPSFHPPTNTFALIFVDRTSSGVFYYSTVVKLLKEVQTVLELWFD